MHERQHKKEAKYNVFLKIGLILILLFAIGLGVMKSNNQPPVENNVSQNQQLENKDDVLNEVTVKLFFPSSEYVEGTSQERMIEEDRQVVINDDNMAKEIVTLLINGPAIDRAENALVGAEINDVQVQDNIAMVDLVKDSIHSEGTLMESLFIESIVRTLDALEGVDGVRILLDGQESETLSGHIDISDVLTSEMYNF